jgi:hypothetical protein
MLLEDLFHLVSLGCVAFFDGAEVWERDRPFGTSGLVAPVGTRQGRSHVRRGRRSLALQLA